MEKWARVSHATLFSGNTVALVHEVYENKIPSLVGNTGWLVLPDMERAGAGKWIRGLEVLVDYFLLLIKLKKKMIV